MKKPEPSFGFGYDGLSLINNAAKLRWELEQLVRGSQWISDLDQNTRNNLDLPEILEPTVECWLVKQLVEIEDGDRYRATQAKLLGACFQAALVNVTVDKAGNARKHGLKKLARNGYADLTPLLWLQTNEAHSPLRHFGSIAFHKPEPNASKFYEPKINVSGKGYASLFPGGRPAIHEEIAAWQKTIAEGDSSTTYGERWAKGVKSVVRSQAELLSQESHKNSRYFQDIISPLLHRRQSTFLAEDNADVSLVLLGYPDPRDGNLDSQPPNLIWLGEKTAAVVRDFLTNGYPKCECVRGATEGASCRSLSGESWAQVQGLKGCLERFSKECGWRDHQPLTWTCRELVEFQMPFGFFNQPVLFTCARASEPEDSDILKTPRGAISLSVAVNPPVALREGNPNVIARWASMAAMVLHQMLSDVAAVVTSIDHEVEAQRVLRRALKSSVAGILARSMAHDVGSHLLANAEAFSSKLGASPQFALPRVLQYCRDRMVWVGEAATSPAHFLGSCSLISQVVEPFFFADKPRNSEVDFHLPYLLLDDELPTATNGQKIKPEYKILPEERSPPPIALPFGLLGAHALYVVIENVLRNAAKYGGSKSAETTLTLYLRWDMCEDNDLPHLLRLRVWDSWSNYSAEQWKKINTYCAREGRDENVVDEGHRGDCDLISLNTGEPILAGGGIKEMRVAACWLRGERVEARLFPGESRPDPPLLRPILVQGTDGDQVSYDYVSGTSADTRFGFEFFLPRTYLCALIEGSNNQPSIPSTDDFIFRGPLEAAARLPAPMALLSPELEVAEDLRWRLPIRLLMSEVGSGRKSLSASAPAPDGSFEGLSDAEGDGKYAVDILSGMRGRWLRTMADIPWNQKLELYIFLEEPLHSSVKAALFPEESSISLEPGDRTRVLLGTAVDAPDPTDGILRYAICHHSRWDEWRVRTNDPPVRASWRNTADGKSATFPFHSIEVFNTNEFTGHLVRTLVSSGGSEAFTYSALWTILEGLAAEALVIDDRLSTFATSTDRPSLPNGLRVLAENCIQGFLEGFTGEPKGLLVVHLGALDKLRAEAAREDWVRMASERTFALAIATDRTVAARQALKVRVPFLPSTVLHHCCKQSSKIGIVHSILEARAIS